MMLREQDKTAPAAQAPEETEWHLLTVEEVLQRLEVDPPVGLSDGEVERRREQYGENRLREHKGRSAFEIFYQQFTEIMVIVLIIAAIISGALGELNDTIAILAIVILNAALGFVQEFRAERAMAALQAMATPTVRVRRNGRTQDVDAWTLVPGDIILLEAGSKVPADGRVVESANLRAQEASLTGESEPVSKNSRVLHGEDIPIGDRHNMTFLGTAITYGRGTVVVTQTGMETELGRIAELIQSVEHEQTPLQRKMAQLGKYLAAAALIIVALVFAVGLLQGGELVEMFVTAVALAVAAVPEGLPAVVTITLALGAQRMLRRQALVRKLPAVETLGSVTVICSDKTGTLTQNRMFVTIVDVAGHRVQLEPHKRDGQPYARRSDKTATTDRPSLSLLLMGGALANDAELIEEDSNDQEVATIGDPTEAAILVAAARYNLWKNDLDKLFPRLAEVPFSSERKRMSTVHRLERESLSSVAPHLDLVDGQADAVAYVDFTKGAPDSLLQISSRVWVDDHVEPLTDEWRRRIEAANAELAGSGLRVLGVAYRLLDRLPDETESEAVEDDLVFVGLVGMIDPPRPEVKEAVDICKQAGIRPIMITGDHPLTALAIAKDLGMTTSDKMLTGQDLTKMSLDELERVVDDVSVYARVSPEHKLNIVQALQDKGQIVAMTGDGVNDAPALRKADIGVAMGITGTDVSREAADMVILDDNFATIVRAVREGRTIYDNVRRFIKYILPSNTGEIFVMLMAPFVGFAALPLTAIQILWINLVTDGLPGLALAVEPTERNVMRRPPYDPNESVLARGLGWYIIWVGVVLGTISLISGLWKLAGWWPLLPATSIEEWRTMVFTTLTVAQLGNALAVRSDRESLFTIGLRSNMAMVGAVVLMFILQMLVIFLPPLADFFELTPLSLNDLIVAIALSTVVFWAIEIQKWFARR